MNCIHLRNRIKESEKERDMPLYRIGQAWIPSLVIRVSFCLLIVVQPSLAINSSTRPTIIKPVKRRQILVRHPSPPFLPRVSSPTRKITLVNIYIYIYSRWIAAEECSWRSYSSRLLLVVPPFDPSRTPFTSRLNDSTCFSFPLRVARRSFPRTDNDPLCLFTRPRQTFRFSFLYVPYTHV